jgi:hypothetical protein
MIISRLMKRSICDPADSVRKTTLDQSTGSYKMHFPPRVADPGFPTSRQASTLLVHEALT